MTSLDSNGVKAQLRLTNQRLGQLKEKKESMGQITRSDIATLLQQGNVALARAKGQKLLQEELAADLLEVLQSHVGLILEHFTELDESVQPSPVVIEAASSVIFAAPHTESKDLNIVRDLLIQRLGPDFARSAGSNSENHVSRRVIRALFAPAPTVPQLNEYLSSIAKFHGVHWAPESTRQDILGSLSEILDPATTPVVDLSRLRRLSAQGLPDGPSWLRPRIWKLLFGILPVLKSSWESEMRKQRASYYDLICRLLKPISSCEPPTTPLSSSDTTLLSVSKQLSSVPRHLFSNLLDEPAPCDQCPLDLDAQENIRIVYASILDIRLQLIKSGGSNTDGPPEIRVEAEPDQTPVISISPADDSPKPTSESFAGRRPGAPTTLLLRTAYNAGGAHQKHASALLRLLYVHTCLNPANKSPHLPSLLVPLYSVLVQEVEPQDLAHVEADTFWLFEAVIGEFAELEDEVGANLWVKRLSERVAWADDELYDILVAKGLDPKLPHYSYRWMASLLTQALPLSSVVLAWDALFSHPMRTRGSNPKLEYLLDLCASLLIRARAPLFRIGKSNLKSPSLWADEDGARPVSPLRAWELGDAFIQGMSLLQKYPVEAAGGIDMVLQTASDLLCRREEEAKFRKNENLSLGARLKESVWKGFTNQVSAEEEPEVEEDDDASTPTEDGDTKETKHSDVGSGIGSRLANAVWKGFTNQSSMEVPPSPVSPLPPSSPLSPSQLPPTSPESSSSPQSSSPPATRSFWAYAEKVRDSDAIASLSKVSTNWRAKAMAGAWSISKGSLAAPPNPTRDYKSPRSVSFSGPNAIKVEDPRRGSLPEMNRPAVYSPPARPLHFASPRDSMLPQPRRVASWSSPPGSPDSAHPPSDIGLLSRTKHLQTSLASLTGLQAPSPEKPKTGPKPLLLSTSSVTTASSAATMMRSATSTPTPHQGQWTDALRMKAHQKSQSSLSSLKPIDAVSRHNSRLSTSRLDWESDGGSRVVPLNKRRSVSPMPRDFNLSRHGISSGASSETNSDSGLSIPASNATEPAPDVSSPDSASQKGWSRFDSLDSPSVASPPPPATPVIVPQDDHPIHVNESEPQRGSLLLSDLPLTSIEPLSHGRKLVRKKTPMYARADDTSDSKLSRSRARSRKSQQRLSSGKVREQTGSEISANPSTLAVEGPDEQEAAVTPRAATFKEDGASPTIRGVRRLRKTSGEHGVRLRKVSGDGQEVPRKVSADGQRQHRDSAAEEGDDEGYDELLSAYESEEGQKSFSLAQAMSIHNKAK